MNEMRAEGARLPLESFMESVCLFTSENICDQRHSVLNRQRSRTVHLNLLSSGAERAVSTAPPTDDVGEASVLSCPELHGSSSAAGHQAVCHSSVLQGLPLPFSLDLSEIPAIGRNQGLSICPAPTPTKPETFLGETGLFFIVTHLYLMCLFVYWVSLERYFKNTFLHFFLSFQTKQKKAPPAQGHTVPRRSGVGVSGVTEPSRGCGGVGCGI